MLDGDYVQYVGCDLPWISIFQYRTAGRGTGAGKKTRHLDAALPDQKTLVRDDS